MDKPILDQTHEDKYGESRSVEDRIETKLLDEDSAEHSSSNSPDAKLKKVELPGGSSDSSSSFLNPDKRGGVVFKDVKLAEFPTSPPLPPLKKERSMQKDVITHPVQSKETFEDPFNPLVDDEFIAANQKQFKYNLVFDIVKVFRLETFLQFLFLSHILTISYNLILLPVECLHHLVTWVLGSLAGLVSAVGGGSKPKAKSKHGALAFLMLSRLALLGLGGYILAEVTNPSMIFHLLRGQGIFKLYMIKAVNEIFDMIFKHYGQSVLENWSRANLLFIKAWDEKPTKSLPQFLDWLQASGGLLIYGVIHSMFLCLEQITLHVVLISSPESIFSFLFYNNFAEIKITVFKKTTTGVQYFYGCHDGVERAQILIYLSNLLLATSKKKRDLFRYCLWVGFVEILTDHVKHFFLSRLNKDITMTTFYKFKGDLHSLQKSYSEGNFKAIAENQQTIKEYHPNFQWQMFQRVMDVDSTLSLSAYFNIFPQLFLVIRNLLCLINQKYIFEHNSPFYGPSEPEDSAFFSKIVVRHVVLMTIILLGTRTAIKMILRWWN